MQIRPNNIKVRVSSLQHIDHPAIIRLFYDILADYCERFQVLPRQDPVKVYINFICQEEGDSMHGMVVYHRENNDVYMIQVQDPFLQGMEDNDYSRSHLIECICHEIVHVCQQLTGRNGCSLRGLTINHESEVEKYLFDPIEIEARAMAGVYLTLYAGEL